MANRCAISPYEASAIFSVLIDVDRGRRGGVDHFVTVDGHSFHYVRWGALGSPKLVLLHGGGSSAHGTWDGTAPDLAQVYDVIAVDQRGHGESGWDSEDRYSVEQFATDTLRVLETMGVEQFDLIGHSLGGLISLVLASRYSGSVRKLIIIDAAPRMPGMAEIPARRNSLTDRKLTFPTRAEAEAYARMLLPEDARDRPLNYGIAERDGTWTWRTDIAGMARSPLFRDSAWHIALWSDVAGLRCPTLVMRAGRPQLISSDAVARLAQANSLVRVTDYPTAGHWLHQAEPERFIDEALAFLSTVTTAASNDRP